jgi:hypothetical protein
MIDVENEIFSIIAKAVRNVYPDIYMVGEYVQSPPKFPCVSLVEMDNSAYTRTQTSSSVENHVELMYELNVYSNKKVAKRVSARQLLRSSITSLRHSV